MIFFDWLQCFFPLINRFMALGQHRATSFKAQWRVWWKMFWKEETLWFSLMVSPTLGRPSHSWVCQEISLQCFYTLFLMDGRHDQDCVMQTIWSFTYNLRPLNSHPDLKLIVVFATSGPWIVMSVCTLEAHLNARDSQSQGCIDSYFYFLTIQISFFFSIDWRL